MNEWVKCKEEVMTEEEGEAKTGRERGLGRERGGSENVLIIRQGVVS